MKIIRLNPPGGSHYDGPMIDISAVVGQLKKRGFRSVTQLDLRVRSGKEDNDPPFPPEPVK